MKSTIYFFMALGLICYSLESMDHHKKLSEKDLHERGIMPQYKIPIRRQPRKIFFSLRQAKKADTKTVDRLVEILHRARL